MRRSGKTTRLIDRAVQSLFEGDTLIFPSNLHLSEVDYFKQVKLSFKTKYKYFINQTETTETKYRLKDADQKLAFNKFLSRLKTEHNIFIEDKKSIESKDGWIVNLENFKRISHD